MNGASHSSHVSPVRAKPQAEDRTLQFQGRLVRLSPRYSTPMTSAFTFR